VKSGSVYQRNFYIFTNEDSGFEAGQKPSGHVKIEVREGRGRLHTTVQNLRAGNGRFEYVLYLLCGAGERMEAVRVGPLKPGSNKSELDWNFNPNNVGQSGYPVNAIDIIAILVEYAGGQQGRVLCPLAAYRSKRVQWRSGLAQSLLKKDMSPEIKAAENAGENADKNAAKNADKNAAKNADGSAVENAYGSQAENAAGNAGKNTAVVENETEDIVSEDSPRDIAGTHVEHDVPPDTEEFQHPDQQKYPEQSAESDQSENLWQSEQSSESEQSGDSWQSEQPEHSEQSEQPGQPEQPELNSINTGCVYLNGNMCGAFVQSGLNSASPCGTCSVCRTERAMPELPGDLSMLKAALDNNFEKSDPFHIKRSDYIWWKVTNPVNLNNILYQNNIRSPLMFNPAVMMAHYKYRHLIIGIFTHMNGKRYVVCGVPGMHMVDRKPFGELSTWVQTQRSKPRYGSFGYWLVYINPEDGKILNISQH